MKKKNEYIKWIENFFVSNEGLILKIANKVKKNNLMIPLEIEDLINNAFIELLNPEYKLKYYKNKEKSLNDFEIQIKNKLRYIMFSHCNNFKTRNHEILNKAFEYDENESVEIKCENYKYEELFLFLTKDEFYVIYELIVNKYSKQKVANNLNISGFKLNKIIDSARRKIFEQYNLVLKI